MVAERQCHPMMREVKFTEARNLTPLFNAVVREERPVMIVRGGREHGVMLSLRAAKHLTAAYALHVDVIPEESGAFTLWIRELNIGASGATLREARDALLSTVKSYVRDYVEDLDFYRHLTDLAAQEPYVFRLSLAADNDELAEMLFGAPESVETL